EVEDLDTVETEDHVAVTNPGGVRRGGLLDRQDAGAAGPVEPQIDGPLGGDILEPDAEGAPVDPPMSHQLVHDPAGQVDRDAEADALAAAAAGGDRRVDADDLAPH